jgi:hypothetical protein
MFPRGIGNQYRKHRRSPTMIAVSHVFDTCSCEALCPGLLEFMTSRTSTTIHWRAETVVDARRMA